jgi:4-cresol dehydrogenase (hydroxylating)
LHTPSAAIDPLSEKEVQAIVTIANKYKTPLWTVCNGENEGYGSAAPASLGQIVLDLRSMKKIIEVDQELGYCLVEPGVTYAECNSTSRTKISICGSTPPPAANVSIVGSILERGSGYTPYSESFLFPAEWRWCWPTAALCAPGWGIPTHQLADLQVGVWSLRRQAVLPSQ